MSGFKLDDSYVEVAERVRIFRDKHPQGALQSEITFAADGSWVLCKAWAYRSPEDTLPGVGHSRLSIPGTTPYTRGSEVENAETSAWGRAIIASLAADAKRIASADEVLAKRNGADGESTPTGDALSPPAEDSASPKSSVGSHASRTQAAQGAGAPAPSPFQPPEGASPLASEKQVKFLSTLISNADKADLNPDLVMNFYGPLAALTKKGASEAIEAMQAFVQSGGEKVPTLAGANSDDDIPF